MRLYKNNRASNIKMEAPVCASPENEKLNETSIINYIYIGIIFIYGTISSQLNIDGMGRLPLIANIFICIFILIRYQSRAFNAPYLFWWLWIIYSIINTEINGGIGENSMRFYTDVISGAIIFFISAMEYECNAKRFLKFLTILLLVYILFGFYEIIFSPNIVEEGDEARHLSSAGNMLPITCTFFFYISMYRYLRKELKLKLIISYSLLAFVIIWISATRKAFGAALIILIFYFLSDIINNPKNAIKNILILLIGYFIVSTLMEDSILGERIAKGLDTSENEYSGNLFLQMLDDRAIMYILGWNLFLKDPITGVGLRNFMDETGFDYVLHSEYMVQLAECGIIGTILFVSLYSYLLKNLIGKLIKGFQSNIVFFHIGLIISILFLSFTTWTYQFPIYFLCLGLIMGYLNTTADAIEEP